MSVIMIMIELLDFASLSVTCTLENIKAIVVYHVSVLVHVSHGPITQLAVVDDCSAHFSAVTEGKRSTGERFCFDAFDFTLAN